MLFNRFLSFPLFLCFLFLAFSPLLSFSCFLILDVPLLSFLCFCSLALFGCFLSFALFPGLLFCTTELCLNFSEHRPLSLKELGPPQGWGNLLPAPRRTSRAVWLLNMISNWMYSLRCPFMYSKRDVTGEPLKKYSYN